jgi:hypothetical protein
MTGSEQAGDPFFAHPSWRRNGGSIDTRTAFWPAAADIRDTARARSSVSRKWASKPARPTRSHLDLQRPSGQARLEDRDIARRRVQSARREARDIRTRRRGRLDPWSESSLPTSFSHEPRRQGGHVTFPKVHASIARRPLSHNARSVPSHALPAPTEHPLADWSAIPCPMQPTGTPTTKFRKETTCNAPAAAVFPTKSTGASTTLSGNESSAITRAAGKIRKHNATNA